MVGRGGVSEKVKRASISLLSHARGTSNACDVTRHFACDDRSLQPSTYHLVAVPQPPLNKHIPRTMDQHKDQSEPSPPTMHNKLQMDREDQRDGTLSPQSSTCIHSTSSQDPVLTRGELIDILDHISAFAQHYGAAYHGIGCSYHELPYSARVTRWVVSEMRDEATKALTALHVNQLPDLVSIFGEVSLRLGESQDLLCHPERDWQAAEAQLRRCDLLLQEAEIRMRFLQAAVWNMWFAVEYDKLVTRDEGDVLAEAQAVLKNGWLSVLPNICFMKEGTSEAEKESEKKTKGRSESTEE